MTEQQAALLILAAVVFAMFTGNFAFALRSYRNWHDGRSLRHVVNALILFLGTGVIFTGRMVPLVPDPEIRAAAMVINGAVLSGALILGGIFLNVSWYVDGDGQHSPGEHRVRLRRENGIDERRSGRDRRSE